MLRGSCLQIPECHGGDRSYARNFLRFSYIAPVRPLASSALRCQVLYGAYGQIESKTSAYQLAEREACSGVSARHIFRTACLSVQRWELEGSFCSDECVHSSHLLENRRPIGAFEGIWPSLIVPAAALMARPVTPNGCRLRPAAEQSVEPGRSITDKRRILSS